MTVVEDLIMFIAMREINGIDPGNALDRLPACPDWFTAGGGGCGCPSPRLVLLLVLLVLLLVLLVLLLVLLVLLLVLHHGRRQHHVCCQDGRVRRMRRYMPTGPGPPAR